MLLYEQNVWLRLSLIDGNNAKQNYQNDFGVHLFCTSYNIILSMQVIFPSDNPGPFKCMTTMNI